MAKFINYQRVSALIRRKERRRDENSVVPYVDEYLRPYASSLEEYHRRRDAYRKYQDTPDSKMPF